MNESDQPKWREVPSEEFEREQVAYAVAAEADPACSHELRALHWFRAGNRERALTHLRRYAATKPNVNDLASVYIYLGGRAEQLKDYESAVVFYRESYQVRPTDPDSWYFTNNNLGFSLNQLGQFTAGEEFCRQAIAANPNYSNGHKNLGLALVGQGRLREAAESFAHAIRVTPGDPRSLYHLKALLRENPVLIPDYEGIVQNGEQAYQSAINQ